MSGCSRSALTHRETGEHSPVGQRHFVAAHATVAALTGLSETNKTFAPGKASTPVSGQTARRRARATTFSFKLDQAATVTVTIQRKGSGRRVRHACKPPSNRLRHNAKCTLYTTVATLARTAHAGLNKLEFTGRVRGRVLRPAQYQALFSTTDAAGSSRPQAITFTIAAR
jgi:hypothetical protein